MTAALAAAIVCGCTNNSGNSYTISGTFQGLECDSVRLMNIESDKAVVATAALRNGSFTFSGQVDTMFMAVIIPASDSVSEYCRFILEPGKLQMVQTGELGYSMKGTKANDANYKFMQDIDRLMQQSENGGISVDKIDFEGRLKANLDNWFGVYCLNNLFSAYGSGNNDAEAQAALEILDMFPDDVKLSSMWHSVYNAANSVLKIAVGKPYLDFTQNDMDGNPVTAADVISDPANKYVLIDFWASWCGPCMGELPYLKETYAQYAPKGFQILGVSLDQERESWVNAVRDNGMDWIHVSDLNYWANEVAEQYNINSVPSNFLIDCSTGLIIAKDLRGEGLAEQLAELSW